MNDQYVALFFSILTFIASTGVVFFLRAVSASKTSAIKYGFYLILLSFLCGIVMMSWAINHG